MQLLGLKSVDTALRVCTRCLHMFRWPLYDERQIYSAEGDRCRKENYEKTYPGQVFRGSDRRFDPEWFAKSARIFEYLSHLLDAGFPSGIPGGARSDPIRILDWGGGDGYVGEALALVSSKVLGIPCEAHCYDYTDWKAAPSPYMESLGFDQIAQNGKYDIIILSHILEHTAFPAETIQQCLPYLSDTGILLIVVPFEQPTWLFQKDTSPTAHQSAFSARSINHLLASCGLKPQNLDVCFLSYRVFPMWNIVVSATRADGHMSGQTIPLRREIGYWLKALARRYW